MSEHLIDRYYEYNHHTLGGLGKWDHYDRAIRRCGDHLGCRSGQLNEQR